MVKVLHLALFAILLISFATCDESGGSGGSGGSGESDGSDSSDSGSKPLGKSKENKKHEIGNDIECDEPTPTNKCSCDFTDGLKNLSSNLDSCQQSNFLQWVQEIESSILVNVGWTSAKRAIQVYYSYKKFANSNANIHSILKFKSIKKYGLNRLRLKDLQSIAYSFADETVASTISLDGNNNCNLFDALRSAANSCGASTTTSATTSSGSTTPSYDSCSSSSSGTTASSEGSTTSDGSTASDGSTSSGAPSTTSASPSTSSSAPLNCASFSSNVNVLISQITVILQDVNSPTSSQLAQIYVLLNSFFAANPGSKSLVLSVQISGFYSVESFFDLSFTYQQSTSISSVLSGDFSTNPLLLALEKAYKKALKKNVQIGEELQAFYDIVNAIFISTSDPNERLKKFSLEYYQFIKDLPDLQEYLDDLELTVDGKSWGTLSDLVFISANIVFPQADSSLIDSLISPSSNWNQTILIQAFYSTYTNWNKTYNFHNYGWGNTQWALFRNAYLNNNISLIISSATLSNKQKHKRIFEVLNIFISGYVQKQFFYCIPLGKFGRLADYKKKVQTSPAWNCEVPRGCSYDRNNLISIQSDNSTLFTTGWKKFVSNLTTSEQAQFQSYTDNILSIIYGPVPSGGVDQQVSQVVTVLKNVKTAVPSRASDVDKVLVGKWGKVKKFCECQSTATTKQYPS